MNAPRYIVALATSLLAAVLLPAAAAAETAAPDPRPVLLLIHGGGFYSGTPAAMDYAAGIAAVQGAFATRQPAYPLNNLPAAFERIKRLALGLRARGRTVFAYGDSAGGAIAAWLASRGHVRATAAKSPPTALLDWDSRYARRYAIAPSLDPRSWRHLHAGRQALRAYSSAYRPSKRPLRIFQSCADTVVPCEMNIDFARRDPRVSLAPAWGQHGDPASRAHSFGRGLAWLTALLSRR